MLSRIEVKNYRSFLDAKVNLSPFTLVIGAKGNFFLEVAEEMDLDEVAQKSSSFAQFRNQVVTW